MNRCRALRAHYWKQPAEPHPGGAHPSGSPGRRANGGLNRVVGHQPCPTWARNSSRGGEAVPAETGAGELDLHGSGFRSPLSLGLATGRRPQTAQGRFHHSAALRRGWSGDSKAHAMFFHPCWRSSTTFGFALGARGGCGRGRAGRRHVCLQLWSPRGTPRPPSPRGPAQPPVLLPLLAFSGRFKPFPVLLPLFSSKPFPGCFSEASPARWDLRPHRPQGQPVGHAGVGTPRGEMPSPCSAPRLPRCPKTASPGWHRAAQRGPK